MIFMKIYRIICFRIVQFVSIFEMQFSLSFNKKDKTILIVLYYITMVEVAKTFGYSAK